MKSTCDYYDEHAEDLRILPSTLRHFGGRKTFSGKVVTVKCFEDNSRLRELCKEDGAGKVLVVDAGGATRCGLMGDLLAGGFQKTGWEGLVIWGAVRDSVALGKLDMGIMAILSTPRKTFPKSEGQAQVVITVDGAVVKPGDTLVADEDGAVLLP